MHGSPETGVRGLLLVWAPLQKPHLAVISGLAEWCPGKSLIPSVGKLELLLYFILFACYSCFKSVSKVKNVFKKLIQDYKADIKETAACHILKSAKHKISIPD